MPLAIRIRIVPIGATLPSFFSTEIIGESAGLPVRARDVCDGYDAREEIPVRQNDARRSSKSSVPEVGFMEYPLVHPIAIRHQIDDTRSPSGSYIKLSTKALREALQFRRFDAVQLLRCELQTTAVEIIDAGVDECLG